MNLVDRVRRRIRILFRRLEVEAELSDEIRLHLEMEADELVRQGWGKNTALREARLRLGGVEQTKESVREVRPLQWLDGLRLDLKLGLRILRKSWGLTLVGGLAMTLVIGIAAAAFTIAHPVAWGTLPLDEGDRVVGLMTWDEEAQRRRRPSLHDFERWRDALRSVEDVAAFRELERSLVRGDGLTSEPVSIVEMTASGFELARVPPLLGRTLLEADELDSASPVVVIGYDVWQSRFVGDPAIVGRTVQLGRTAHTVVGVMPEDFAFPVNDSFWIPLRANLLGYMPNQRDVGLEVFVFARLAPGMTLGGAEAELTTIGLVPSIDDETVEQLEPRVVPYTLAITSSGEPIERLVIGLGLFLISLLLVPPCANLAVLIYARTVTRQEEFAARYALGASRGRIVAQLFVEVLVLAAVAAGVALALLRLALTQGIFGDGSNDPFWIDYTDLSFPTVLFAASLAIFAAVLAGVVPALQATRNMMRLGLHSLGSRTGLGLGTTWTALVVAQVAISVAALPTGLEVAWGSLQPSILGPGFAAEEFLTARIAIEEESSSIGVAEPSLSRFGSLLDELTRRLEAEPGVSGVTVSAAVPGLEPSVMIEVEDVDSITLAAGIPRDEVSYHRVAFNHVDNAFFNVFDVGLLAGRRFDRGDIDFPRGEVVVNRTFAEEVIGNQNPLGRRVRYVGRTAGTAPVSEPWHQIVGVVDDIPANMDSPRMYHLMAPGQTRPVGLSLRMSSATGHQAARLREIATSVEPTLLVHEILPLDQVYRRWQLSVGGTAFLIGSVALSVLLLSAAGVYALMSFTVARRRREIGICAALGAQPHLMLAGIFRRALRQLAAGAFAGLVVALYLELFVFANVNVIGNFRNIPSVVPATAGFMMLIGLIATVGPARRALRVEPTEALRDS